MTDKKKITQTAVPMTEGQRRAIKNLIEPVLGSIDIDALGLTKEEAQEIIEKGDLIQNELKQSITASLKKHAIIDQRYGAPLVEFDLTVPMNYKHVEQIDQVKKKVKELKTAYYYNDDLSSKNFANATNKLEPGKTYRVKIYPILQTVTSEDNMNFLKRQRAILVGGQGLMLAQDLHSDKFPKGKWIVSFDEKETLWKDADGDHRVPDVHTDSDGAFEFLLGYFEHGWHAGHCLLCFCDK